MLPTIPTEPWAKFDRDTSIGFKPPYYVGEASRRILNEHVLVELAIVKETFAKYWLDQNE